MLGPFLSVRIMKIVFLHLKFNYIDRIIPFLEMIAWYRVKHKVPPCTRSGIEHWDGWDVGFTASSPPQHCHCEHRADRCSCSVAL